MCWCTKGASKLHLGMKETKEKIFCNTCGARSDYPGVVIVMEDGRSSSSDEQLRKSSKALKVSISRLLRRLTVSVFLPLYSYERQLIRVIYKSMKCISFFKIIQMFV